MQSLIWLIYLHRYEREVNHGHCSAIKRILSGDAPASSMMVLCVSAINPTTDNDSQETPGSDSCSNVKVELTDGWYEIVIVVLLTVFLSPFLIISFLLNHRYSMNAALDVMLTKQLNAGKLFVGQKLRVSYFPARFKYFVLLYMLVRSLTYSTHVFLSLI